MKNIRKQVKKKKYDLEHTTFSSTLGGVRPGGGYRRQLELGDSEDTQENQLLKKIAMNISNKIDKAFVNANIKTAGSFCQAMGITKENFLYVTQ